MSHHLGFCPVWQLEPSQVCNQQYTMVPAGPHPRGFRGFGRTLPRGHKVRSTERNFFYFCVLFVSGPWCNHSVLTARMHKIAGFGSIFPKFSQGSIPRTPKKSLGFAQAHFGPPENKKNPPVWTLAYGHGPSRNSAQKWRWGPLTLKKYSGFPIAWGLMRCQHT